MFAAPQPQRVDVHSMALHGWRGVCASTTGVLGFLECLP